MSAVFPHIGLIVADILLKATLILLLPLAACTALRRTAAAYRHFVLLCAFVALLLVPCLRPVLPAGARYHLTVPTTARPRDMQEMWLSTEEPPAGISVPTALTAVLPATPLLPIRPAMLLCILYVVGVLFSLGRTLAALGRIHGLGKPIAETDDAILVARLDAVCRRMEVSTSPSLRLSDVASVPMTWGWRKPVILLPVDALDWPAERQSAALLHEAAHIARGDWAAQLFARFVCALYWFHPLVWLTATRLRAEAERACDDRVLLAGVAAPDYAQHLLDIARARTMQDPLSPVTTAMAYTAQIEYRLRALLDPSLIRRLPGSGSLLALSFCTALGSVLLATLQPVGAQPLPPNPIEDKIRFVQMVQTHNRLRQQEQRVAEIEARLAALKREEWRLIELHAEATIDAAALDQQKALLRKEAAYFDWKATGVQKMLEGTRDKEEIQFQVLRQRASQIATEKDYLRITLQDTENRAATIQMRLQDVNNGSETAVLRPQLLEALIARDTQKQRLDLLERQFQAVMIELARLTP